MDADTEMKIRGSTHVSNTKCQLCRNDETNDHNEMIGLGESSVVCNFCKNAQAKIRLQPCEHDLCTKCAGGSGRCVECGAFILYYESLN